MSHILKKILCGVAAAFAVVANASPLAQVVPGSNQPGLSQAFDKIGRSYVENKGQWNSDAVLLTRQPGMDFWVTKTGIVLDTYNMVREHENPIADLVNPVKNARPDFRRGHVVKMSFVGSRGARNLVGSDPIGTRLEWIRFGRPDVKGVHGYGEATVQGFLPGVDVRFYREETAPRYDLVLAPNVNPNNVALFVEGADDVDIAADGSLAILTSMGWIRNGDLTVYQGSGARRSPVRANFKVERAKDGFIVRFILGKYDATKPLVIDPIVYGTHFGGDGGGDEVMHAASDGAGNTYFTGMTLSPDLPIVTGPYGVTLKDSADGFFAQLTGDVYDAVYVAYVGTGFDDFGRFLDVDQYGNVWMAGSTMTNRFPGRLSVTIGVPQGEPNPWGGTWGLTYGGIDTDDLNYRINATQLKAALDALPNAPAGGFTVDAVDANGNVLAPTSQLPETRMRIRTNAMDAGAIRLRVAKRPYVVTPATGTAAAQQIRVDFTAFGFSPRQGNITIQVDENGTLQSPNPDPGVPFNASGAQVQAYLRTIPALLGPPNRVTATGGNLVQPLVEPVNAGVPVNVNFTDAGGAAQARAPMVVNFEQVKYGLYDFLDVKPRVFLTLFKNTPTGLQAADDNAANPSITRLIEGVTAFAPNDNGVPFMADNASVGIAIRKVTQAQGNVEIVVAGNAAGTISHVPADGGPTGNQPPTAIPGTAPTGARKGYFITFTYNNTTSAISVDNNRTKYIGGTGRTTVSGVDMDAEGSVYLAGGLDVLLPNGTATNAGLSPASPIFATTAGGFPNSNLLRQKDGWFRKYDPSGTMLISKVLGGSSMDRIEDIAVDASSNIYVLSRTMSFNYPRTVNAFSEFFPGPQGGTIMAVTKLNSTATSIVYSTSLETLQLLSVDDVTPNTNDNARFDNFDLAVDGKGNAYSAGYVIRPLIGGIPIPLTPVAPFIPDQLAALDTVMPNGDLEGYLTVLNSTGGGLLFSTVIGNDNSGDYVNGLFLDRTDAVYLGGASFRTGLGNPLGLPGNMLSPFAFKPIADDWDGWIAKLKVVTPILSAIATDRIDVAGGLGSTVQLQVLLQRPAPVGGASVTLRISNPAAARFNNPVSGPTNIRVTIPAGQQIFPENVIIYTRQVSAPTPVDIRAELDGDFLQTRINVHPWMQSFTLGSTSIEGGESVNGTVTIFEPAPAGGIPVNLSADSGLVSFPNGNPIVIPAGEQSISFEIASQGVSTNTDVNITASAVGVGITQTLQLTPVGLQLIEVNPDRVTGGESTSATVQVGGVAGPSTFVQISSTGAPVTITRTGDVAPVALPALVQIPEGQNSATFQVNTSFVASNTSANIIATLGGDSTSDTLFIEHVDIVDVVLSTTTCTGGDLVTGVVNISAPAGLTGMVIPLTNSNPAAGTVTPMTVTIAPGATSGAFQIQTEPVSSTQTLIVATDKVGYVNKNATLTINPLIIFFDLVLTPATITGGAPAMGTINLPFPVGIDLTFQLESTNPLVTFPGGATLTIPAGQTSRSFTINTGITPAATDVLVRATLSGVSQQRILRVLPPGIANFVIQPNLVNAGQTANGVITLDQPAPAGGLLINLSNNEPLFVSHAPSITVPAGQTQMSFPITTFQVTRTVSVKFTATIPARSQSYNAILTITPAP